MLSVSHFERKCWQEDDFFPKKMRIFDDFLYSVIYFCVRETFVEGWGKYEAKEYEKVKNDVENIQSSELHF